MPYELELEELRQIQAIVARHEDHAFKIRGVMYALLTALTLPLFAEKRVISGQTFLTLSAIVVVLLLVVELVHRAFVRLAIERGAKIEQILRDKEPYDGPKIAVSLGQSRVIEMMIKELFLPSIAVHYVALLVALGVMSWVMW